MDENDNNADTKEDPSPLNKLENDEDPSLPLQPLWPIFTHCRRSQFLAHPMKNTVEGNEGTRISPLRLCSLVIQVTPSLVDSPIPQLDGPTEPPVTPRTDGTAVQSVSKFPLFDPHERKYSNYKWNSNESNIWSGD